MISLENLYKELEEVMSIVCYFNSLDIPYPSKEELNQLPDEIYDATYDKYLNIASVCGILEEYVL